VTPEIKGVIGTLAVGLLGAIAKILWNRDRALQAKIRALKAQEQTRWEKKVDHLETQLAISIVANTELKLQLSELKKLIPTVDKLSRAVLAFEIWKRMKFPEDGNMGGNGGDLQGEPTQ
jgi:hypothetical protein